jgi:predicted DNA-binding WGR domain protein
MAYCSVQSYLSQNLHTRGRAKRCRVSDPRKPTRGATTVAEKDHLLTAKDYEEIADFPLEHKMLLSRSYPRNRADADFDQTARSVNLAKRLSSWDPGLTINSCTSEPDSIVRYCPRSFPRVSQYPVPPRQRSSARGSSPVMTPVFTRLQKRNPERNQHRYYLLTIQPNLFGTWSLNREWGRIGRPGRVKIDLCDSLEEATMAFHGKLHQKQRRGYA